MPHPIDQTSLSGSTNSDLFVCLPVIIQHYRQALGLVYSKHSITKRKERQFYQNYRSFMVEVGRVSSRPRRARSGRALRLHWSLIHFPPSSTLPPLYLLYKHSTAIRRCCVYGGGGESRTLGCGLAQVTALRPHCGLIHYCDQFDSPSAIPAI